MSDFKVISTQEELDRVIGERLARQKEKYADYDDLKERNVALESEKVSLQEELDKATKARTELETRVSRYESDKLKTSVALRYGLPIDFAERLQGEDEESLQADAERLSGLFKSQSPTSILKDVEPTNVEDGDAMWRQVVKDLSI